MRLKVNKRLRLTEEAAEYLLALTLATRAHTGAVAQCVLELDFTLYSSSNLPPDKIASASLTWSFVNDDRDLYYTSALDVKAYEKLRKAPALNASLRPEEVQRAEQRYTRDLLTQKEEFYVPVLAMAGSLAFEMSHSAELSLENEKLMLNIAPEASIKAFALPTPPKIFTP